MKPVTKGLPSAPICVYLNIHVQTTHKLVPGFPPEPHQPGPNTGFSYIPFCTVDLGVNVCVLFHHVINNRSLTGSFSPPSGRRCKRTVFTGGRSSRSCAKWVRAPPRASWTLASAGCLCARYKNSLSGAVISPLVTDALYLAPLPSQNCYRQLCFTLAAEIQMPLANTVENLKLQIKMFENPVSLWWCIWLLTLFVLFGGLCVPASCSSSTSSLLGVILGTSHVLCLTTAPKVGVLVFHFQENSG